MGCLLYQQYKRDLVKLQILVVDKIYSIKEEKMVQTIQAEYTKKIILDLKH